MAVIDDREGEDGSIRGVGAVEQVSVSDAGVTWNGVRFVDCVPGEEWDLEGGEGDGSVSHV